MTFLYLIRHGETELNQSRVYYGSTDCDLNHRGIEQANGLKHLSQNIDVMISSPMKRAINTAKIIGGPHREIIIEKDLREIDFGKWEGLHYKEISHKYNEEWQDWINDWKYTPPPTGESFMDLYRRVKSSMENILSRYGDKRIIVVSHQGCLRIIASILINMEEKAYWNFTFEHGKYSLFEIEGKHSTLRYLNAEG